MDEIAPSLHQQLGGDTGVRALVDAFYTRMDTAPAYARLRAIHPPQLEGSRDKLYWFLCGWLGGPQYFAERYGHPRLRARHMPFAVDNTAHDQWLACMQEAMAERAIPAPLVAAFWPALSGLADWMRNSDA